MSACELLTRQCWMTNGKNPKVLRPQMKHENNTCKVCTLETDKLSFTLKNNSSLLTLAFNNPLHLLLINGDHNRKINNMFTVIQTTLAALVSLHAFSINVN